MVMRPFFPYFGAKWRAADRYPAPQCDVIIEPFAGAAGYSTRRSDGRLVWLIDASEAICGVWDYIIHASEADVLALPDVRRDLGERVRDLKVCQEARWLIGFWVNPASSEPKNVPTKWSHWGPKARERIVSQQKNVRHWRVFKGSYLDLDGAVEATWYVDPPYQVQGRCYPHGADGIDYAVLGEWCRGRTGQVIACENAGALWLPFEPLAMWKSARPGRWSEEVIWHRPAPSPPIRQSEHPAPPSP